MENRPYSDSYTNPSQTYDVRHPKLYGIKIHNDDYTPMEFVVHLLIKIFRKEDAEARSLMIDIHQNGVALVGVYCYDIASTKKIQSERMSDEAGHPLKITMDEVVA